MLASLQKFPMPLILFTMLLLSGCGSLGLSYNADVASEAKENDAKAFTLQPGRASIYFVRKGDWLKQEGLRITIDETEIGFLGANTFILIKAKPAEQYKMGVEMLGKRYVASYGFEPSKLYFVEILPTSKDSPPKLIFRIMGQESGKASVLAMRRVNATLQPIEQIPITTTQEPSPPPPLQTIIPPIHQINRLLTRQTTRLIKTVPITATNNNPSAGSDFPILPRSHAPACECIPSYHWVQTSSNPSALHNFW